MAAEQTFLSVAGGPSTGEFRLEADAPKAAMMDAGPAWLLGLLDIGER